MKFHERSLYADPDVAARKIVELANGLEPYMDSPLLVERIERAVPEREGVVASDPEAIATFIKLHAPHVVRIGLETGATSTWLWTELNKMGLPVICIDARFLASAQSRPFASLRRSMTPLASRDHEASEPTRD